MKNIANIFCVLLLLFVANIDALGQAKPKAKKLERSVVLVKCFDENHIQIAWGSGVIIDAKGTCITNYHVIEKAYFVRIKTQEGFEFDMDKITGQSEMRDLVRFTIKNSNTTFIPVVLCKKLPEKGDDVWAMGTPVTMDNMNAFTHGEITNIKENYRFFGDTVLQINNAIAHGSSGGGLFNSNSELVGITSAGRGDEDGARAAMNYAIYAREILELERVNKDRLESAIALPTKKNEQEYKPAPVTKYEPPKYEQPRQSEQPKGRVCFYSRYPCTIDISIDGNYGTIDKYFSMQPLCGQDGTVTFTLSPGTYSYSVLYKWGNLLPREFSGTGTVYVSADKCEFVPLAEPKTKEQLSKEFRKKWVVGTNFTNGVFVDKFFDRQKYRLQMSFILENETLYKYNKFGLDFDRVFSTRNHIFDINFGMGPSIRYQNGFYNFGHQIAYNPANGSNYFTPDSLSGINNLFLNLRISSEITFYDRVVFHAGLGYGYSTQGWVMFSDPSAADYPKYSQPSWNADYDLWIGYKFGIKNKHGHKQSLALKYVPQLVLPGWTDYKLSSGTKGKFKMGLFISSAAIALGSKIYSNSEYRKYTSSSDFNTTHYNNANISNKIFLVSSGVGASLYVFDIVHFFTKLKEIKH